MTCCLEAFFSQYAITHNFAIIRCSLALNRPIQEEVLGPDILNHDAIPGKICNFVLVLVFTFCHSMFVVLNSFFYQFPCVEIGIY